MITHALLVPRLLTVVSGQDSALPVSALTLVLTVLPPHHWSQDTGEPVTVAPGADCTMLSCVCV